MHLSGKLRRTDFLPVGEAYTDGSAIREHESPLTSWHDKSDGLMKHLIAALVSACLEIIITTCDCLLLDKEKCGPRDRDEAAIGARDHVATLGFELSNSHLRWPRRSSNLCCMVFVSLL